jgi:transposase
MMNSGLVPNRGILGRLSPVDFSFLETTEDPGSLAPLRGGLKAMVTFGKRRFGGPQSRGVLFQAFTLRSIRTRIRSMVLHRTRHLCMRQQISVINAIRAHFAEFGIVAAVGRKGVEELLDIVADPSDKRVPEIARACLAVLGTQLRRLKEQILEFDRMIRTWHRSSEMSMRLDDCPGVGPVLATALVATVADPNAFRSGRNFSAWIGLVPKQHSSGGKNRLGSISKQGDRYLRGLFVIGALAVIRYAKIHGTKHRPWLTALLARKPAKVAAIALANKIARMVWAMMARGERYKEPIALAA